MNKLKEKWNKIPKWLKIVLIVLLIIILISSFGSEDTDKEETKETTIVETCVEKYSLQEKWCKTMYEYIPSFNLLSNIEENGTSAYKVSLSNGQSYYIAITMSDNEEEREVAKIQTTEKDYDSRTVLYDKFSE